MTQSNKKSLDVKNLLVKLNYNFRDMSGKRSCKLNLHEEPVIWVFSVFYVFFYHQCFLEPDFFNQRSIHK